MQLTWWHIALLLGWAGICCVWLGLLIAQFRAKSEGLLLRPVADSPPASEPPVAVVIPARNEAENIGGCLESVLSQNYGGFRVIVADDRSEDGTGAIAARIARSDDRVQVVRIDELPAGWMGKTHALWKATQHASEEWLLYIDADCRLDPPALRTAITVARSRHVQFLSLWPRQARGGFWEHLLIPLCAGIIALWYRSPQQAGRSRRPPFANGQFLLIHRDAYERIGGHEAVRTALIEDVMLAERIAALGIPAWSGAGAELFSVRMYRSLAEIVSGWTRIYVGALRSRVKLLASVAWLLLGSAWPYAALLWGLARWQAGQRGPFTAAVILLGGIHLFLMMLVSMRFWRLGRCRRIYLLAYPVSVIVVIAILLRAERVLSRGSRVRWRGTDYTISPAGTIA